jgi:hypothetical protein
MKEVTLLSMPLLLSSADKDYNGFLFGSYRIWGRSPDKDR